MAAPVISTTSSYLGFRRNEPFQFVPFASNNPLSWAMSPVPGLSIDTPASYAVTGVASTDVLTATGHPFADGDRVYFSAIAGGTGLTTNTIYFVRDVAGNDFKLAASLGASAVNFSADISSGTIRKVSTGTIISSGISVQGPIIFQLSATNGDGTGTQEFVIGIGPGSALGSDAADTAIDLAVDLPTGIVKLGRTMGAILNAELQPEDALAFLKSGDTRIFAIRFFKDGTQVDPDLDSLRMVFKEFAPENVIIEADSMEKVGEGANAVFRLAVSITRAAVAGALSNYESDKDTSFDSRVELEWKTEVTHASAPLDLVGSSQTFALRLSADLATN
jgi:hypothetical protein